MGKLVRVFMAIVTIGFCAVTSPAHSALIRACRVENPPANCDKMWALIAHVRLSKQPIVAVNPAPRCQSDFESVNWGKTVADALEAEVRRATLENLAMDISDAIEKKTIPQITRHFQGEAATLVESNFSKLSPTAWSPSATPYDQTLCAPVIATVPANATVKEFRFRASDENLGEMGCTASIICPIGYCRFVHGYGPATRNVD
jgi:hypothetical protein